MPGPCPSPEKLAAAVRGEQPGGADMALAAHLSDCPVCQARIELLAGGSGWLMAKAKAHGAIRSDKPEPLRHAMEMLESHMAQSGHEPLVPPDLHFLQSSDKPGVKGRFGAYEVIEHVASGGMGIVLKARDPALDRVVALKILAPALAGNALARARFVREARAAAAVAHEHVVPIYAVDEWSGLPYLVMQFVEGRTLSERIRATGPLRLEEILRIGTQTAAGLAAAHAQGLIHRDIKPGNILLENSVERVKLTDFGLARAADDTGLTRTGELAGTPEFMAPEQATNGPVDHRADLFSLGTVLYAMSTGRSPFESTSVIATVRKVCDEQPLTAHELNPAIPRWLSDLIVRLMAKEPAARFQSAKEVSELLEQYLARVQHGELGVASSSSNLQPADVLMRRRTVARAAAAVAVVVMVALGLLLLALRARRTLSPASGFSNTNPAPFVVRSEGGNSIGAFTNLEAALQAAPSGAVVELSWTGPREMTPVQLPAKALTLRAGRGFQPKWICSSDSASALSASMPLALEHVWFEWQPSGVGRQIIRPPSGGRGPATQRPRLLPAGIAIVSITNASLRVANCALVCPDRSPDLACINLMNANACHLENTLVIGRGGKAVVWQHLSASEAKLVCTNCVLAAAEGIWLDLGQPARASLELIRSTFAGRANLHVAPSLATALLEVNARRTLFSGVFLIHDERKSPSPSIPQWLHWHEEENLYNAGERLVRIEAGQGPGTLAEWYQWWGQTGGTSRRVGLPFISSARGPAFRPDPVPADPKFFQIVDLRITEGSPLPKLEWSNLGAAVAFLGPAWAQ